MELGKLTQEQLDKLVADAEAAKTLVKGYESKVNSLQSKVSQLDEFEDIKRQLEEAKKREYKTNLDNRLSKVSKYLDKKGRSEDIIKRIGDMSNEDFEFFFEGKTNEEFKDNEEIEFAKTDLEKKQNEIESSKDKIIKDYLKSLEDSNKTKNDQKLVPTTEVGVGDTSEQEGVFPNLDKLKEVYRLNNNPIFTDKTERMLQNAKTYMDTYGGIDQDNI